MSITINLGRRARLVLGLALLLAGGLMAMPLKAQVYVLRPAGEQGVVFEKQYFGLLMHRAETIKWPAAAFGSWRLWDAGVSWADIEKKPGVYDFAKLDRYVAFAKRFGLEVVFTFGLTPQWASRRPLEAAIYGSGRASEPADLGAWRRFVAQLTHRYAGRIHAYQVWNEANLKEFYTGDVGTLVAMTRILREEAKRVDPNALIIGPSAAGLLDARRNFLGDFLRAGGGAQIDRMAFHLYTSQQRPERMISPVQDLMAQARAAGYGKLKLWNTETGYLTRTSEIGFGSTEEKAVSEETAAAYLVRGYVLARALGVERFYWYAWDDGKYPMTKSDLSTLNEVGSAYANLVRVLSGARLFECSVDMDGATVCRLQDSAGHPFRLAWSSRDGSTLWTFEAPVSVQALNGRMLSSSPSKYVPLDATPVLIKTMRAGKESGQ